MRRRLLSIALLLVLAFSGRGWARSETYCVGGYSGLPPGITAACGSQAVESKHLRWHFHTFVAREGLCFVCFDEEDNSCVTDFLREHPEFSIADEYECFRNGVSDQGRTIFSHVIDGQVNAATPPPPPALRLQPMLEAFTPGPYAAGQKIAALGVVRDERGAVLPITGGTLRVIDSTGAVQTFPKRADADGMVRFEFPLPSADGVSLAFTPDPPPLNPRDTMLSATSSDVSLRIDVCSWRAQMVTPAEGVSLVSLQEVELAARVEASPGVDLPFPAGGLSFTILGAADDPIVIPADADLKARWTPPPSPDPRQVRILASGQSGGRTICRADGEAGEITATVSDLGIGYGTTELPEVCWAGLPCRGTLRLARPPGGPARARVDALLASPDASVILFDGARVLATFPVAGDDRYPFEEIFANPQSGSWSAEVRFPGGSVAMAPQPFRVRPPLRLHLQEVLDLGEIGAGTDWPETCQRLSFEASSGVEEHHFQVALEGVEGCVAEPVIGILNDAGVADAIPLHQPATVKALDPDRRWLSICLQVPRCVGETSPEGAALRVTPMTPVFAEQAATVRLRWRVEERPWLRCYATEIGLAAGGGLAALLLAGWWLPHRFPAQATITVAGSVEGLRRSNAMNLLDCPGSSAGLFRSARLALHGDGQVDGRARHAVVLLKATEGGVLLQSRGPLEMLSRRTRQWEVVEDAASGHVPSSSVVYRAGSTCFKVGTS